MFLSGGKKVEVLSADSTHHATSTTAKNHSRQIPDHSRRSEDAGRLAARAGRWWEGVIAAATTGDPVRSALVGMVRPPCLRGCAGSRASAEGVAPRMRTSW